jgi:hypothetical protein
MILKILSTSRDLVGDLLSVRAEILEHRPGYARVRDTIEVEIPGGARLSEAEIRTRITALYHG